MYNLARKHNMQGKSRNGNNWKTAGKQGKSTLAGF